MLTPSTAVVDFFWSVPGKSAPILDIPIVVCPACEKRCPMTIKSISPRMRMRDGAVVEYFCATCGVSQRKTVKPSANRLP